MRKFLATPFSVVSIPIFVIALLIRFGLVDSIKIIEDFIKVLKRYQ